MPLYILLTRVDASAIASPDEFQALNEKIGERIRQEAPEVQWHDNYTVLGPYDYLDVFEAPDNEVAARVALIIRSMGHTHTEIWPAVTWERFQLISKRKKKTA